MKTYVAGFLFNDHQDSIVLIRKNKPEWQAGLLNGVGGKIEKGEGPLDAMIREFREETGAEILDWTQYAILTGPDYQVHFFYAQSPHNNLSPLVSSMTTEEVCVRPIYDSGFSYSEFRRVPNLRWLIPMAVSHLNHPLDRRVYHIQESMA